MIIMEMTIMVLEITNVVDNNSPLQIRPLALNRKPSRQLQ